MFRDFGWQQRYSRFCGRVVVLSILSLLLYPFLWAWTIIGTLWFTKARDCVSHFSWCSLVLSMTKSYLLSSYPCSYLKKVKNGGSWYGCSLVTVDFVALLSFASGRSVSILLFIRAFWLCFYCWSLSALFPLTVLWVICMHSVFLWVVVSAETSAHAKSSAGHSYLRAWGKHFFFKCLY